jgi:hypothetical protein
MSACTLTVTDPWVDCKYIVAKYGVSHDTARRWIMRIHGDDARMTMKHRGRGKRPYRLRRISRSLLEKNIPELLNG